MVGIELYIFLLLPWMKDRDYLSSIDDRHKENNNYVNDASWMVSGDSSEIFLQKRWLSYDSIEL